MRILITGITGFAGSYLASLLTETPDAALYGVARNPARLLPSLQSRVTCFAGDLRSDEFVADMLKQSRPDMIYHLAGQAFVPTAWSDPWGTFELNVLPQLNLLKEVISLGLGPKFLSVTSSKVYGHASYADMPLKESTPLRPDNPYGLSKVSKDLMAQQYHYSHKLPIIIARPFNHIGPRQNANFVTASFARQIALAEAGLSPPVIRVGNLTPQRDFTDVRDVVRAYTLLMDGGIAGEAYNVGSGQSVEIQSVLDKLINFSQIDIAIEPDKARMRPVDQLVSYGDISKIKEAVGWQPEIPLDDSLRQTLNYWRKTINN